MLWRLHSVFNEPSKIVFSPFFKEFVLIDFGASHTVAERQGLFSSPLRMEPHASCCNRYEFETQGYVDFYWNDAHVLSITLEYISSLHLRSTTSLIAKETTIGAAEDITLIGVQSLYETRTPTKAARRQLSWLGWCLEEISNSFWECCLWSGIRQSQEIAGKLSLVENLWHNSSNPSLPRCDDKRVPQMPNDILNRHYTSFTGSRSISKDSNSSIQTSIKMLLLELEHLKYL